MKSQPACPLCSLLAAVMLTLSAGGCDPAGAISNTPDGTPAASGGSAGSSAGTSGSGTGGGGESGGAGGSLVSGGNQSGGVAGGAGGASGSAGLGGSAAAGSSGFGGGGGSGVCPAAGTQADPGAEGDGKLQLDAPYTAAPETLNHLNAAPKGKVNELEVGAANLKPLIYEAKTQYPGLNNMLKYEYWIYVPAQYKPGCAAALMVFQDGVHYVGVDDAKFNTPTVFDNLIESGDMPVTIGVFINPGEPGDGHYNGTEYQNRTVQYDRNSPNYVSFLVNEFLADVVLPKYDIVSDPDGWAISGHSSGGIAAYMAGWHAPDKFRKLLTHSASFSNTGDYMGMSLMESLDSSEKKPLRVYLMSGPNDLGGWYGANTQAADKLAAKGYHYQYRTETNGHYPPVSAVQDYANALRWLWRGYSL